MKLHQWRAWNNTQHQQLKFQGKKGETKIRTRYRQAENEDITELLVGERKKGIIELRRTWCNNRSAEIFVSYFFFFFCFFPVWFGCPFVLVLSDDSIGFIFSFYFRARGVYRYRVVSIVGGTNYTFFGPIFTMTTVMLLPPMPLSSSSLFSPASGSLWRKKKKKKRDKKTKWKSESTEFIATARWRFPPMRCWWAQLIVQCQMPIVAKRNDRFLTRDSPTTSAETLNRLSPHPSNNDIVDPPENIKKGGKKKTKHRTLAWVHFRYVCHHHHLYTGIWPNHFLTISCLASRRIIIIKK